MTDPQAPAASDPSAVLSRIDGWTPAVQEAFIAALIETGSVRMAAAAVGMHFTSAYRLRARDPVFAGAWNAARAAAYARLRDEAMQRAIEGTVEEVWHQGERVGTRVVHDNRLLMQMLEHLKAESLGEGPGRFHSAFEDDRLDLVAQRFDALVAPPQPAPPRPRQHPGATRLRPANGRLCPAFAPASVEAAPPQPGVRVL